MLGVFGSFGGGNLLYPTLDRGFTFEWLSEQGIARADAASLYKNIMQYAPAVSCVASHFRRGIITPWVFVGTTPQMQDYIDNSLEIMATRGEPMDTQLEKLASYGYWSGALFGEVVIDSGSREFTRFGITNPFRVRFKPNEDEESGFEYILGIYDTSADDNFSSWVSIGSPRVAIISKELSI